MALPKTALFVSAVLVMVQAFVIDTPLVRSAKAGGGDNQPSWYQASDHPVHALFHRQNGIATDGHDYLTVGSSSTSRSSFLP